MNNRAGTTSQKTWGFAAASQLEERRGRQIIGKHKNTLAHIRTYSLTQPLKGAYMPNTQLLLTVLFSRKLVG